MSTTTERLYDDRPLRGPADARFDARVVAAAARGERLAVALDRTLFYPAGGGQPCDRGTLGGAPVVDVTDEAEVVWHHLERPAAELGAWPSGRQVDGEVDLARRQDHAAHHSGQHLLSAVLWKRHQVPTVSFHLGVEEATIDVVPRPSLGDDLLARVEDEVNALIRAALPVTASVLREPPAIEAAAPTLRKRPDPAAVASPRGLRVVRMGAEPDPIDREACCGTHVSSTAEIGALLLLGAEKGKKGETRLRFACGARAIAAGRARRRALDRAATALSATFDRVPERVQALLDDARARAKELAAARGALLGHEGAALARAAAAGPGVVVGHLLEGGEPGDARELARAVLAARPDLRVAVVQRGPDSATLVVARGPQDALDAGAIVKQVVAARGGRGGGAPAQAQGSVPDPKQAQDALAAAVAALSTG